MNHRHIYSKGTSTSIFKPDPDFFIFFYQKVGARFEQQGSIKNTLLSINSFLRLKFSLELTLILPALTEKSEFLILELVHVQRIQNNFIKQMKLYVVNLIHRSKNFLVLIKSLKYFYWLKNDSILIRVYTNNSNNNKNFDWEHWSGLF